jgi:hypothetical protein
LYVPAGAKMQMLFSNPLILLDVAELKRLFEID